MLSTQSAHCTPKEGAIVKDREGGKCRQGRKVMGKAGGSRLCVFLALLSSGILGISASKETEASRNSLWLLGMTITFFTKIQISQCRCHESVRLLGASCLGTSISNAMVTLHSFMVVIYVLNLFPQVPRRSVTQQNLSHGAGFQSHFSQPTNVLLTGGIRSL